MINKIGRASMKEIIKSRMSYLDFSSIASLLDIFKVLLILKSLFYLAIAISVDLNVDLINKVFF